MIMYYILICFIYLLVSYVKFIFIDAKHYLISDYLFNVYDISGGAGLNRIKNPSRGKLSEMADE